MNKLSIATGAAPVPPPLLPPPLHTPPDTVAQPPASMPFTSGQHHPVSNAAPSSQIPGHPSFRRLVTSLINLKYDEI